MSRPPSTLHSSSSRRQSPHFETNSFVHLPGSLPLPSRRYRACRLSRSLHSALVRPRKLRNSSLQQMCQNGEPVCRLLALSLSSVMRKRAGLSGVQNVWFAPQDHFLPCIETRSTPGVARCYPHSFTFYVAPPSRSIFHSSFYLSRIIAELVFWAIVGGLRSQKYEGGKSASGARQNRCDVGAVIESQNQL